MINFVEFFLRFFSSFLDYASVHSGYAMYYEYHEIEDMVYYHTIKSIVLGVIMLLLIIALIRSEHNKKV